MHCFVKICGLTTPGTITAAVDAGADALGFVFAESPRRLTPEQAVKLCAQLPPGIIRVAVMLHPKPEEWNHVRDVFAPDWLQTDLRDYEALDLRTIKMLPVYRFVTDYENSSGHLPRPFLFESSVSGQGIKADWNEAAFVAVRNQLILAGGLTPDNVTDAIRRIKPWGVDVSSGVESAPGVKDPAKIAAFVRGARAAEQFYANKNR